LAGYCTFPAHELIRLIAEREITAEAVTRSVIERIEEIDGHINAYLAVCHEEAIAAAIAVDGRLARGESVGPLAGIPVGVKDAICTRGLETKCASRILDGFVPPYDATVITRLKSADAIVVGKTNMDQFGMGSSNENSGYGIVRNPVDPERVPGGSSGGSAAALAANEAVLALGEDTGGSIRQPAAFCGVVGLKPTYGRVSRYGIIAYGSSFDQVGPMARNVEDCARMLQVIAGHDRRDSTSSPEPVENYRSSLKRDIKGLKIGIPKEYFAAGLDSEVEDRVKAAIRIMEDQGAHIESVSLPNTEYAIATYYVLVTAEASSNLARYDGVRYGYRSDPEEPVGANGLDDMYVQSRSHGFGMEVKRRIMLGTYVLSAGYYDAYYAQAQKVRTLIKRDYEDAFKKVDVLVAPTTPSTAFKVGEKMDDPLQMYLTDIYTVPGNLAGVPGISLPCGTSSEGLPVGLQIIGPQFGEAEILRAAYAYEQAR
jgi:aspartyl-tRNA(Asn)/glutamyl-tRNA(Gln) amidotransferase subunit A